MRRRTTSVGRDLRALMIAKEVERRDRYATAFGSEFAPMALMFDRITERWRNGEPMEIHAWQLPDWARAGIHPNTRVVVTADGAVEPVQPRPAVLSVIRENAVPPDPSTPLTPEGTPT